MYLFLAFACSISLPSHIFPRTWGQWYEAKKAHHTELILSTANNRSFEAVIGSFCDDFSFFSDCSANLYKDITKNYPDLNAATTGGSTVRIPLCLEPCGEVAFQVDAIEHRLLFDVHDNVTSLAQDVCALRVAPNHVSACIQGLVGQMANQVALLGSMPMGSKICRHAAIRRALLSNEKPALKTDNRPLNSDDLHFPYSSVTCKQSSPGEGKPRACLFSNLYLLGSTWYFVTADGRDPLGETSSGQATFGTNDNDQEPFVYHRISPRQFAALVPQSSRQQPQLVVERPGLHLLLNRTETKAGNQCHLLVDLLIPMFWAIAMHLPTYLRAHLQWSNFPQNTSDSLRDRGGGRDDGDRIRNEQNNNANSGTSNDATTLPPSPHSLDAEVLFVDSLPCFQHLDDRLRLLVSRPPIYADTLPLLCSGLAQTNDTLVQSVAGWATGEAATKSRAQPLCRFGSIITNTENMGWESLGSQTMAHTADDTVRATVYRDFQRFALHNVQIDAQWSGQGGENETPNQQQRGGSTFDGEDSFNTGAGAGVGAGAGAGAGADGATDGATDGAADGAADGATDGAVGNSAAATDPIRVRLLQRVHSRRIPNMLSIVAAIRQALPSADVQVAEFDGMSLEQQISWTRNASVFVAVEGAGLYNALFLRRHAALVMIGRDPDIPFPIGGRIGEQRSYEFVPQALAVLRVLTMALPSHSGRTLRSKSCTTAQGGAGGCQLPVLRPRLVPWLSSAQCFSAPAGSAYALPPRDVVDAVVKAVTAVKQAAMEEELQRVRDEGRQFREQMQGELAALRALIRDQILENVALPGGVVGRAGAQ
jgi:hypothetical protein